MNYFGFPTVAERYAHGRPYFHPLVIERIKAVCGEVGAALDVGCGTGQSTIALAEIAERVVGADISADMLRHAPVHPRVSYIESPAEILPVASGSFDLVSVGLAIHWFERPRFLAEAARVLRSGGWLAIYNDGHRGEMIGNDAYARWNRDEYAMRYPTPARNAGSPTDDAVASYGFVLAHHERFTHDVMFSAEELVRYLLTQSNVVAAVEAGTENIASIAAWIAKSVGPLFQTEPVAFPFDCSLDIFERAQSG